MAGMVYFLSMDDTGTVSIGLWLLSHAQFILVELGAWQYLITYNMILKKKNKKKRHRLHSFMGKKGTCSKSMHIFIRVTYIHVYKHG